MELKEIEERVAASLVIMNSDGFYDFRPTFYNRESRLVLDEACLWLAEGKCTEADLKDAIAIYRADCEVSYIDFRIKVPEPDVAEWKRMNLLFGSPANKRLVPPRDLGMRRAYLQVKTLNAMRLTIDNKQPVSTKLRQQFNWLMVRAAVKSPELLAVAVELESYNPYHKRLSSPPPVNMTQHLEEQTTEEVAPKPQKIFGGPTTVDNSSFESRLPPASVKQTRQAKREPDMAAVFTTRPQAQEIPHELPEEIHEEFAAYCANLYEKTKGN